MWWVLSGTCVVLVMALAWAVGRVLYLERQYESERLRRRHAEAERAGCYRMLLATRAMLREQHEQLASVADKARKAGLSL